MVAEVGEHDARRVLALEPGKYFVRSRASDHLLEGQLELGVGQTLRLQAAQLSAVEYARLARKGGTERESAHGPWLGVQLRSSLWSEASLCKGLRAGYAVALPRLSLSVGLGACRSRFDNDVLGSRIDDLDLDLSLAHVWDFSRVSVAFGGLAGASWLRQRFETPGRAPGRDSFALGFGAVLGASFELTHGFYPFAEALGQVLFFEQRRSSDSDDLLGKPAARFTLGMGKHF